MSDEKELEVGTKEGEMEGVEYQPVTGKEGGAVG
jgi:hypothetical protein